MRSQISQLSILILLSLTSHSVVALDCVQAGKDLQTIAAQIAVAQNALNALKDKQVQLGANYTQNCDFCGTFYPYDTVNGISAPASIGFQGGVSWKDNSPEYVGHGNASSCGKQAPCPGVISTNPAAPGAYMSCGTGEIYDRTSAYYLANHPDLTWVSTNLIGMFSVSNTIRINGGLWPFMFGRVLINGRYSIGKLHAGNNAYGLYVQSASGSLYFTTGFEVLTCNVPSPCCTGDTTTTPITTTTTTELLTSPQPRICNGSGQLTKPLFDAQGYYVKSICETTQDLSVVDAQLYCRQYGMQLFAMTTKEEYLQGIAWVTQMHGTRVSLYDHVDGVLENGTWYVYNPVRQPLYIGAVPVNAAQGNCMKMAGNGSAILIYSTSCTTDHHWSFCEVY